MLVEKIIGNIKDTKIVGLMHEVVKMDHYDLDKPHQKVESEEGNKYAVSLPQGEHLSDGDILYIDDERAVFIDLIPEEALEIKPRTNVEWGVAAFNIGNMHKTAYLHNDRILSPYDPILAQLLEKAGLKYKKTITKLTGLKANITSGHHHHHDH